VTDIAIAGGTGPVGRKVADLLHACGHNPAILARTHGVDLVSGEGIGAALAGAEVVIDVTNTSANDSESSRALFERRRHRTCSRRDSARASNITLSSRLSA
jgi:uncharacterized protein YbjT (DUF2867 family)